MNSFVACQWNSFFPLSNVHFFMQVNVQKCLLLVMGGTPFCSERKTRDRWQADNQEFNLKLTFTGLALKVSLFFIQRVKKNRDPRWEEEFQFTLEEPPVNAKLHVEVVSTSSRIGLLHPKVQIV